MNGAMRFRFHYYEIIDRYSERQQQQYGVRLQQTPEQ
jgi:hypothetical protein